MTQNSFIMTLDTFSETIEWIEDNLTKENMPLSEIYTYRLLVEEAFPAVHAA